MNNQQLWQAILGTLEVSISKANFNTWVKNAAITEKGDNYITIGVPSSFHQKWISSKYHQEMLKALKSIAPEVREIKYQVGYQVKPLVQPELITEKQQHQTQTTSEIKPSQPEPNHPIISQIPNISGLNPKYIFDSFIIGKNNELAHAASQAVAKNPGTQYNPLFIYGGVGLGKTHLMHAVGNKILQENPRNRVLYVSSEKFTNDYISAIQQKRIDEFKRIYRTVDMLLIDDIQFIAGKEGTQEEFFHTFNELRDKSKQIIMTADRLPKEIPSIEQRLISRFEWGMVADIQAPDLETRMAILRTKIAKRGVSIDEEILYYIAENVITNIRELEGALNRLLASQDIYKEPPTIEQAKQILANMVISKKKALTLRKIAMLVSEFYNITIDDLIKQSRRKEYVKPRQIAMYLARKELSNSFPIIGEFFGGRDHTTVMHGVEKMEKLLPENDSLKQEIELILDKLYAT